MVRRLLLSPQGILRGYYITTTHQAEPAAHHENSKRKGEGEDNPNSPAMSMRLRPLLRLLALSAGEQAYCLGRSIRQWVV